jgi:hypothetical protein
VNGVNGVNGVIESIVVAKAVWVTESLARPNGLRYAPGSELERAGRSSQSQTQTLTADVK